MNVRIDGKGYCVSDDQIVSKIGKKPKQTTGLKKVLSTSLVCLGATYLLSDAWAWSPSGGAEQAYFNQYVYESLDYIPQTPVYNSDGSFSHWEGPTLQEQLATESNKQMGIAQNEANAVNQRNAANLTTARTNAVDGTYRSINDMKNAIQVTNGRTVINDSKVQAAGANKSDALAKLARAQAMTPDGPDSEQKQRMSNRATAGGNLDSNRDGVISKNERLAALSTRPSMRTERFINPDTGIEERKLDLNRDGNLSKNEWQSGLQEVAGTTVLDHNAMIAQRKVDDPNYTTPGVNEATYTDAKGNVSSVASLSNTGARQRELEQAQARLNVESSRPVASSANDLLAAAAKKGVGSGAVPNQVTSSSSITTRGTWGRTHSDSKTYNVASDSQRSQSSTAGRINSETIRGTQGRSLEIQSLESRVRAGLPD